MHRIGGEMEDRPEEGGPFLFSGGEGGYILVKVVLSISPPVAPAGPDPGRTSAGPAKHPPRAISVDNPAKLWTTRRTTSQMFAFVNSSTPAPGYAGARPMITAAAAPGPAAATPAARPDHRLQPAAAPPLPAWPPGVTTIYCNMLIYLYISYSYVIPAPRLYI